MTWQNYFKHKELACPCCNVLQVTSPFLENLAELREEWNRPLIVNSCCRCVKHNIAIGGAKRSFHLFDQKAATGLDGTVAIDISNANMTGADRHSFIHLAMKKGWSIGVAKTFIHIDRRADYPETGYDRPILFTY